MKESFDVLVVDDEEDFLGALVQRLNIRKLKAHGVKNGEDALGHLGKNPVDVVVLDIKMPGMDGLQVLKEIKKAYPMVEVIMLTGHASVESSVEGIRLGAFDYLIKPVKLDELVEKIVEAFDRKQTAQGMKIGASS